MRKTWKGFVGIEKKDVGKTKERRHVLDFGQKTERAWRRFRRNGALLLSKKRHFAEDCAELRSGGEGAIFGLFKEDSE